MVVKDSEVVEVLEVVILFENTNLNGDVGIGQGSSVGAGKEIIGPGALSGRLASVMGGITKRDAGVAAVQAESDCNMNK